MPDARRQGRIFKRQWREQRVAHHLHVLGRIVQVALRFLQVEQRQRHLVLHDVQIGARLRGKRIGLHVVLQTVAEALVILALMIQGRRADVVELLVQVLPLVLMQSGGSGRDG